MTKPCVSETRLVPAPDGSHRLVIDQQKAPQEQGGFKPYTVTFKFDGAGFQRDMERVKSFAECLPNLIRNEFANAFIDQVAAMGTKVSFSELVRTDGTASQLATVSLGDIRKLIAAAMNAVWLKR